MKQDFHLPIKSSGSFGTNSNEQSPSSSHNSNPTGDSDSQGQVGNFFNIPTFTVFNCNFYRFTENKVSTADLDKQYSATISGKAQTIYTLKGQSPDTGIVLQIGFVYCYYEYIYNGVFSFESKKYGLKEEATQEKGQYLGEAEGLKLYEVVGNDTAILVDMAPVINLGDCEFLYVATLLE